MEKIAYQVGVEPEKKTDPHLQNAPQKVRRNLLNNAGIFTGVFIMFAVVVIVTTDISVISPQEVTALGLGFFLLMFCSYSMYVSCADSGMRAGLKSTVYCNAVAAYDELKNKLSGVRDENLLYNFCRRYIEIELMHARMDALLDVGFSYDTYVEKYLGKDKREIKKDPTLTKAQKGAIWGANKIAPIKLMPDMIVKRGRGNRHRGPLGMRPVTKKRIHFVVKFLKTVVVAFAMCLIVLDFVAEPSWTVFATCCMKLLTVAVNGFEGYRFGHENIVSDTVNYMNDQMDLMEQALSFAGADDAESDATSA